MHFDNNNNSIEQYHKNTNQVVSVTIMIEEREVTHIHNLVSIAHTIQ